MATGLFGLSPSEVMQQRNAALQAQAQQYAQLDPLQRASSTLYQAGGSLAGALGGMFGLEDPAMKRAKDLQGIASQFDLTTPEGLNEAARALVAKGYNQEAMQVAQKAQEASMSGAKLKAEEALTEQRLREKQAADPFEQLIRAGKYTPESLKAYQTSKNPADLVLVEKEKDTRIKYSTDTEELSAQLYDKPYQDLTTEERTKVLVKKEQNILNARRAGASSISNVLKQPPAVVASVDAFDKATEAAQNTLKSAALAKQLISEAGASNNSQTWEAARTTVAKAVGENKLSNEDIKRTGVDPRLVQGALDWVNKKISGVPTQEIMKQLYVLSSVLENTATQQINVKADRARAAAKASGFEGDVNVFFPKVGGAVPSGQGTTRKTKSGVEYSVESQ